MTFIKIILIIFLLVLVFGLGFIIMFVKSIFNIKKQFGNLNGTRHKTANNAKNKSKENKVKYTQNHREKKKIFDKNDGEYVDFEE